MSEQHDKWASRAVCLIVVLLSVIGVAPLAASCGGEPSRSAPTQVPSPTTTFTDRIAGFRITMPPPFHIGSLPGNGPAQEPVKTWLSSGGGAEPIAGDKTTGSFILYRVDALLEVSEGATFKARLATRTDSYARSLVRLMASSFSERLVFVGRQDATVAGTTALDFVFEQEVRNTGQIYSVEMLAVYDQSTNVVYYLVAAAPKSAWVRQGPVLHRALMTFTLLGHSPSAP